MKTPFSELNDSGRIWLRTALSHEDMSEIEAGLASNSARYTSLPNQIRNCLEGKVSEFLPGAKIVRLTAFNKSSSNNWALPWHQDRVIAVKQRHDIPGFSKWTRKDGYWHCEPPIRILENMIFARVYLDDTFENDGDLEIVLGSHINGKMLSHDIRERLCRFNIEKCKAKRGDILIAKGLMLHRSSLMTSSRNRKILRVDFSADILPGSIEWMM